MTERLDALAVREGRDRKSFFTKIGAAFPNKDGKGWTVLLDAMPAPVEGQFKIMLREPLPKDGDRRGGSGSTSYDDDLGSDGVPF
ncbi:hypothetical protein [Sphingobium olei]|uniref:Uncharacterized protein n=1 Tax=Sphingobium olei TaxID=420955 RepID=A0ABW3NY20_9SPHN